MLKPIVFMHLAAIQRNKLENDDDEDEYVQKMCVHVRARTLTVVSFWPEHMMAAQINLNRVNNSESIFSIPLNTFYEINTHRTHNWLMASLVLIESEHHILIKLLTTTAAAKIMKNWKRCIWIGNSVTICQLFQ